MPEKKPIAFFPTPKEIVTYMLQMVSINNPCILESGFGSGVFLSQLSSISNNVHGIEYSDDFFDEARKKYPEYNLTHTDYLDFKPELKYDVIIGNPPYIAPEKMPLHMSNKLKEIAGTKEANIYYGFIIKSIELLKDEGELIYILPYDFFYNSYAKQLRKYMLENGYFTDIIDFGEIKLFKDAAPETIIFKYKKSKNKKNKKINVIDFIKRIDYATAVETLDNLNPDIVKVFSMDNFTSDLIWSLTNINKLKNSQPLKNIADISVGIVSGCDSVFKIDKEFVNKILKNTKDLELCVKFIKNSNLKNFTSNSYVDYIYIPKWIKTETDLEQYPIIYNYLNSHKERLENRYLSGSSQWFNYLAIRNEKRILDFFGKYKILVPGKTRKTSQWFSISNEEAFIAGDLIMISSEKELITWFLWGYLNSSFFSEYYEAHGAKKGQRTVFTQKLLSELDIPIFPNEVICEISDIAKSIFFNKQDFDFLNNYISNQIHILEM